MTLFWLAFGVVWAASTIVLIRRFRPNRQNETWALALIVAALIYVGFAVAWGNPAWLLIESVGVIVYGAFVIAAKRYSGYWLAIGWLLHPLWDVVLHLLGPGHAHVPEWYALACVSFDVLVAGYLIYLNRSTTTVVATEEIATYG